MAGTCTIIIIVCYVAADKESAVGLSSPVLTALTDAQRLLCADLANKPGFNVRSAIENRSFGRPYSNEENITIMYSQYFDTLSAEDLHTLTESTLRRNRFEIIIYYYLIFRLINFLYFIVLVL